MENIWYFFHRIHSRLITYNLMSSLMNDKTVSLTLILDNKEKKRNEWEHLYHAHKGI